MSTSDRQQRRTFKPLPSNPGIGGGGDWIEGLVEDNNCAAGTLDIAVDGDGAGGAWCDQTITVNDRAGVMAGHTAAQLVDAYAYAVRMYECYSEQWVWRLLMLGDLDECTGAS